MASLTSWTGVWARSGSWWWTEKPGVLQSMGSQRLWHGWAAEQQQQNKRSEGKISSQSWVSYYIILYINSSEIHETFLKAFPEWMIEHIQMIPCYMFTFLTPLILCSYKRCSMDACYQFKKFCLSTVKVTEEVKYWQ